MIHDVSFLLIHVHQDRLIYYPFWPLMFPLCVLPVFSTYRFIALVVQYIFMSIADHVSYFFCITDILIIGYHNPLTAPVRLCFFCKYNV